MKIAGAKPFPYPYLQKVAIDASAILYLTKKIRDQGFEGLPRGYIKNLSGSALEFRRMIRFSLGKDPVENDRLKYLADKIYKIASECAGRDPFQTIFEHAFRIKWHFQKNTIVIPKALIENFPS